jgi:hypothetical protein
MACLIVNGRLIDARQHKFTERLSHDLAKHLPQRLGAGPILVLADNPRVFLSAVRRQLARIAAKMEYYRCQTMDKRKRASLAQLLLRLRTHRFSAKSLGAPRAADVLFATPEDLFLDLIANAKTVYLTIPLLPRQFSHLLSNLDSKSLLVIYDAWPEYYQELIDEHWGRQTA